jgi:ubiquitin carboxyl-terminal hydrolase 22/27/51
VSSPYNKHDRSSLTLLGHYVSYCRVGDQWFKFNDHKVEMASKSDVLACQPYLLFYIIRSLS